MLWCSYSLDCKNLMTSRVTSSNAIELASCICEWWEDAQYLTTGERGEWNVFDSAPDFVITAMAGVPDTPEAAIELANRIREWWKDARYLTTGERGEYNLFDSDPEFVRMAKTVIGDWDANSPSP